MKCKVCGAKIRDGAEFCENCGMKVADERVPYTPSINNRPQRPYKKPWYRKWWIWTILGLLTAVIVCSVCFLTLTAQFNSVYKAGETCNAEGLKITLEKSEDYVSDKDYIQPEKGKKFIRVYFNIKNETGTDMYVSSYGFACYADDFKCEENYMGENITESYGAISNGRSTKLCVCYEVPVNAKSIEVEYKPMSASSSNIYSFKVK